MTIFELAEYLNNCALPDSAEVMIEYPERYGVAKIDGVPAIETIVFGDECDVIDTFCAFSDGKRLIIKHHY